MTLPSLLGSPLWATGPAVLLEDGLGALDYGLRPRLPATYPQLFVPTPSLGDAPGWRFVWRSSAPVRQGESHGVHYATDGETLFGCITVAEGTMPGEGTPLQAAAETAYAALFACLAELNMPHLWRVWNYLADINRESHGLERYRQFNIGRLQAFRAAGREAVTSIPAACALGSAAGPLSIAFLAGRVAAIPVENPRQVSAYCYPPEYGPVSPTFARAVVVPGRQPLFLLSGTASIVGHASCHPGDVVAQTRETLANIRAVLAEVPRCSDYPAPALEQLVYTVYVRHAADLPAVQAALAETLPASTAVIYLQADICRADLLLEIEASGGHPLEICG